MRSLSLLVLLAFVGCAEPSASSRSWKIADAGTAIVIAPDASSELEWLAGDVQDILKEVMGNKLPIERSAGKGANIYLGPREGMPAPSMAELGEDGYVVQSVPDGVFLCGTRDLSTAYAAYDFLEKEVGCRWYLPHKLGTVLPKKPELAVRVTDRKEKPAYRFRSLGGGFKDWGLRNRLSEGVPLGRHVYSKVWGVAHTFYKLLPPEKHFKEHPEWFAEIRGKRWGPHRRPTHGPNTCTSNPGAIEETIEAVRKLFDENPDLVAVTVGPNDGLAFCECKGCQAQDEPGREWRGAAQRGSWRGVLSRRLMLFFNAVARGLRETHPDKLVKIMVYSWYQEPPTDESLKFEDNILVMLTHSGNPSGYETLYPSCYNHAVYDEQCRPNRERFRPALEGWAKRAKRMGIYEYYDKSSLCSTLFPIIHSIREDIPDYRKVGAEYFFSQAGGSSAGNFGLSFYVAAKLLWNPKADVDALLDDFCRNFYGPAAAPMKAYHEHLENTWAASRKDVLGWTVVPAEIMTDDVVDTAKALLKEAAKAAEGDEEVLERILLQDVSLEYSRMVYEYGRAAEKLQMEFLGGDYWQEPERLAEAVKVPELEKLRNGIIEYRKKHAREKCLGPEDGNYVKRLVEPGGIFNVLRLHRPNREVLQRPAWAKEGGKLGGEFGVWLYGHDFDRTKEMSEHEVRVLDKEGKPRVVGELAPEGQAGDRRSRVCVLGPVKREGLPDDKLELEIAGVPGGKWQGSTLFAVYLMPVGAAEGADPTVELRTAEGRERIRRRSFAFAEFPYEGEPLPASGNVKVMLDLR